MLWKNFSLVELLVVLAILTMLITLLSPSYTKVIKEASRTECLARQRGFIQLVHTMSDDENGLFPESGLADTRNIQIHRYEVFLSYAGGVSDLICPNVSFDGYGNRAVPISDRHMRLGYQYFGNNDKLNSRRSDWRPKRDYNPLPMSPLDDPKMILIADDNSYTFWGGNYFVMAPHDVAEEPISKAFDSTPLSLV